jgi:hypothetical protein
VVQEVGADMSDGVDHDVMCPVVSQPPQLVTLLNQLVAPFNSSLITTECEQHHTILQRVVNFYQQIYVNK